MFHITRWCVVGPPTKWRTFLPDAHPHLRAHRGAEEGAHAVAPLEMSLTFLLHPLHLLVWDAFLTFPRPSPQSTRHTNRVLQRAALPAGAAILSGSAFLPGAVHASPPRSPGAGAYAHAVARTPTPCLALPIPSPFPVAPTACASAKQRGVFGGRRLPVFLQREDCQGDGVINVL